MKFKKVQSANISEETELGLNKIAEVEDRSIASIIRRALTEYIERWNKEHKGG